MVDPYGGQQKAPILLVKSTESDSKGNRQGKRI